MVWLMGNTTPHQLQVQGLDRTKRINKVVSVDEIRVVMLQIGLSALFCFLAVLGLMPEF